MAVRASPPNSTTWHHLAHVLRKALLGREGAETGPAPRKLLSQLQEGGSDMLLRWAGWRRPGRPGRLRETGGSLSLAGA